MTRLERVPHAASAAPEKSGAFTREQVLDAMREEGVTIVKAPEEYRPVALNYSGLESAQPGSAEKIARRIDTAAEACGKFLAGGVFTDSFGADHNARREWRHAMTRKYGETFRELYDMNQLKRNVLSAVDLAFVQMLILALDQYDVHSPKAEALRALAARFPDIAEYGNDASIEEKLACVQTVAGICTEFFAIASREAQ